MHKIISKIITKSVWITRVIAMTTGQNKIIKIGKKG